MFGLNHFNTIVYRYILNPAFKHHYTERKSSVQINI